MYIYIRLLRGRLSTLQAIHALVTVDHDPLAYLSGKVITISTSCSGIDTPIFALKVLASQLGFKIDNVFAVENDGPCREELLVSGLKPRYLFDNLLSWIRPRIMKEARFVKQRSQ